jgi:hypothetical protein
VTSGEAANPKEIRIEARARDFLEAHGGAVTLRGSRRHGCCGGTAFVPVAEPGPPDEPECFRAHEVDGITVYLEPDVVVGPGPLVIGLDELWRWQRLRVEGTAIRM